MTDEALAAQPFIDNPDAAENALTGLLQQAQDAGLADPGRRRAHWRRSACSP